ncbi:hypothetical protein [Sphingomonas adhaesiva]|uniref:DUF2946 domain-containing protein n=1 Tax=Sphingomonas adhaesiva TaxID=28212 RepID=A0A2A4ID51_9SPHN|nr:hypothetical protein [Sphingomonas adhaesiva]PCG15750.1 hypothetical protein COA07_01845 [Sphingomonas adhaesiva]
MSFGRLLRACALTLLGVMLLVRMGPMCESMAQAVPIASAKAAMADCDRAPSVPVKKAPPISCAGACVATSVDAQVASSAPAATSASASASLHPVLEGRSGGPSPPPPRTA